MRQVSQATVVRPVIWEGTSLDTGQIGRWVILPARQNTGIVFLRQLENLEVVRFNATYRNISHSDGFVRIGSKFAGMNAVEHTLAILHGTGITNAEILCETENPPENSALFTQKILSEKTFQRKKIEYRQYEDYTFKCGDRSIRVEKSDRFRVSCEFNFDSRHLTETLRYSIVITPESFRDKICEARTFCTSTYLKTLQDEHRALGAKEKNCVILPEEKECFVFDKTEIVRHKILDFIGDIFLCGKPVLGDFYLCDPNHTTSFLFHQEVDFNAV